jgi:hypothetical protein
MTQEDKQLLLTDIYARLSYGFTLYRKSDDCIITIKPNDISTFAHFLEYSENEDFKIYLRPMSSMTKEEYEELKSVEPYYGLAPFGFIGDWGPNFEVLDWLNKHHFDYRGLIKKGLALEALENMYVL